MKSARRGAALLAVLLFAGPTWADDDTGAAASDVWSATILGDYKIIQSRHKDDDRGSFFDQYEFTPNKGTAFPFELGIHELSYDYFTAGDTPQIQLRFASPTSNLGISGSQIDEPFLNQRAELLERLDGLALDFRYWRRRTEDLRLFPDTQGRQFADLTDEDDRFQRDRTGMFAELRLRPAQMPGGLVDVGTWLAPEFSLRTGFEERDGSQQLRFLQDGSNHWGAVDQKMDEESTKAGGGILIAPGGLFTTTFDFDYVRFRHDSSTLLARELGAGFTANDDAVGFIADSNRLTGTVMVRGRIGERAVLEGGFHVSRVKQVDDFTPMQMASGLDHNQLLFYSANTSADVSITDRLTLSGFLKYDQRKNDIERDTPLFNPDDNLVQSGVFLKRWDRVYTGAEAVYALHRSNIVALGVRYEWIDRDLGFGAPGNRVIPEANLRIADRTSMWTLYGRTNLRPYEGLGVLGEVGYRGAPDTGYALDLDKYVYGNLRASYRIPIETMVVVTTFLRGGAGQNHDFSFTSGTGPDPSGSKQSADFERSDVAWGATVTSYPLEDLSVFASYFQVWNRQKYDLVQSDLQRYVQSSVDVDYFSVGSPDHENTQQSFVLGAHLYVGEDTDASLSYSFTRADLDYDGGSLANLRALARNRSLEADIHGLQLQLGHWLRDGLRLQAGYRLWWFDDSTRRPDGTGSVVGPVTSSSTQQSITVGVKLTSDLLSHTE